MRSEELCFCGSGLPYGECHQSVCEKMAALHAKGFSVPYRGLIKNKAQIEGIREACRINSLVLDKVAENIRVGMTTQDIDDIVDSYTRELGGIPAPLNYEGFPKSVCTSVDEKGAIHSIGHETKGVPIARKFLNRITKNEKTRDYVLEMLPQHMKPSRYAADRSKVSATNEMFSSVSHPEDLIYMAKADKELSAEDEAFLWERYRLYTESIDESRN